MNKTKTENKEQFHRQRNFFPNNKNGIIRPQLLDIIVFLHIFA